MSKEIYFICRGTSSNDIINSVNVINKKIRYKKIEPNKEPNKGPTKEVSFWNQLTTFLSSEPKDKTNHKLSEINEDTFSRLTEIGMKELFISQDNNNNNKLFKETNIVYTSLDFDAIESAIILFQKNKNLTICPLPYSTNKTVVKNAKTLDIFKKKFGMNTNITDLKEYWKTNNINKNFISIKDDLSLKIDWQYIPSNYASFGSNINYYFENFKNKLNEIYSKSSNNIFFICNNKFIVKTLSNISKYSKIKYNSKRDIIENSSIWEININNNEYNKYYPTKHNYGSLKFNQLNNNNENYSYNFINKKFILFNTLKDIEFKYLQNMRFDNISLNKKDLITKIINKFKENSKNNNNTIMKSSNTALNII